MSTFRFAARYALLTYAQCDELDPFAIVDLCASFGAECIVGKESHGDGGVHYHAFVDFGRKFQTRNARKFDIGRYHPNLQPSLGNPAGGWDYATKDGEIVGGGLQRPAESGMGDLESKEKWRLALLSPDRETFLASIAEFDPRTLCTSFVSLEKYCDWKYRPVREEYKSPTTIQLHDTSFFSLDQWVEDNIKNTDGRRYIA